MKIDEKIRYQECVDEIRFLFLSGLGNIFYQKQFFKIWFLVKKTPMTVRENII